MKAAWQRWSTLFSARARREQWILGIAALAVVYAVVDALWLTPGLNRWNAERKGLAQKRVELAQLATQNAELTAQMQVREVQTRTSVEAARRDLAAISGQLAEFEKTLVPAKRMSDFLHELLPGQGVVVASVKTLPPAPLIARPAAKAGEGAAKAEATGGESGVLAANLYRHGIEITLAGTYPALVDYLDRLEKSPQKVLFGRMELRAEKYPRSELTLTLYTLSLDRSWLIL